MKFLYIVNEFFLKKWNNIIFYEKIMIINIFYASLYFNYVFFFKLDINIYVFKSNFAVTKFQK